MLELIAEAVLSPPYHKRLGSSNERDHNFIITASRECFTIHVPIKDVEISSYDPTTCLVCTW